MFRLLRGRLGVALGAAGAVWLLAAGEVRAQQASTPAPSGLHQNANLATPGGTQPLAVQMYANPYTNPFLNPLAATNQIGRNDLGWYLFAAQQANGGIGTGRISGTRTDPRNLTSKPLRPVTMPIATRVPGGNAASYFQRGNAGTPKQYYLRQNTQFLSNGH